MEKSNQISFCVLWLSRGPSSHSTSQPPCEGAVFVVCSWRKSPARRGSNSSKISGVLAEPDSESKSVSEDTSVNLSARGQGPGMPGAALHPTARGSTPQPETASDRWKVLHHLWLKERAPLQKDLTRALGVTGTTASTPFFVLGLREVLGNTLGRSQAASAN